MSQEPSISAEALASDRPVSRKAFGCFWAGMVVFYALLWSRWWYPLSDSALYLNMARALARGEGWAAVRQLHRDVRPLTPLLLAGIMRLGAGIGAMHAVMIALTLASHGLAYLTMRRWFNERIALAAVAATAESWWVYGNAFTIMTEPPFLLCFWGAMYALSFVDGRPGRRQLLATAAAAVLLALAWESRMAAAFVLVGIGLGWWLRDARRGWRVNAWWLAILLIAAGLCAWAYHRQSSGPRRAGEAYQLNVLVGVRHPLVDLPVSAGRWVMEVLAAPFAGPFEMKSVGVRAAAGVVSVAIFALACLGWVWLVRRGKWMAAGVALATFAPYLVLWGTRIKPRYMAPIAPILFVQLWAGAAAMGLRGRWRPRIGAILLAGVLAVNLAPYAVEVIVRRGFGDFYAVARRGAFAELVDIGGYLQTHAARGEPVWVNWPPPSARPADASFAPDKRIVQFLSDREVRFIAPDGGRDGLVRDPQDREGLQAYFAQVRGDWAVVYYSELGWPSYHLPLRVGNAPVGPAWWQLFHRSAASGAFEPVRCPVDRGYVRGIPGWNGKP